MEEGWMGVRFFNDGGILISDSSSTIKERGTQTSLLTTGGEPYLYSV